MFILKSKNFLLILNFKISQFTIYYIKNLIISLNFVAKARGSIKDIINPELNIRMVTTYSIQTIFSPLQYFMPEQQLIWNMLNDYDATIFEEPPVNPSLCYNLIARTIYWSSIESPTPQNKKKCLSSHTTGSCSPCLISPYFWHPTKYFSINNSIS